MKAKRTYVPKSVWIIKDGRNYWGTFVSLMAAPDWADLADEFRGPYEYIELYKPRNRR